MNSSRWISYTVNCIIPIIIVYAYLLALYCTSESNLLVLYCTNEDNLLVLYCTNEGNLLVLYCTSESNGVQHVGYTRTTESV